MKTLFTLNVLLVESLNCFYIFNFIQNIPTNYFVQNKDLKSRIVFLFFFISE